MTGCRLPAPSGLACPAAPGLLGAAGPPGVCWVGVWRGHPDTQPARLEDPLTGREVLDLKAGHSRGGRGGRWPSQWPLLGQPGSSRLAVTCHDLGLSHFCSSFISQPGGSRQTD